MKAPKLTWWFILPVCGLTIASTGWLLSAVGLGFPPEPLSIPRILIFWIVLDTFRRWVTGKKLRGPVPPSLCLPVTRHCPPWGWISSFASCRVQEILSSRLDSAATSRAVCHDWGYTH